MASMNQPTSVLPNLLSPIWVGNVQLRNRIVFTGHDTCMADGGYVGDQLLAYHSARAKGGVGLIIVQVVGVHETARYKNEALMAIDDSCIAPFSRLASEIHQHGGKVFVQLFHPGREVTDFIDGIKRPAYAPSVSPQERYHFIPRALSLSMIREILRGYADAANRMKRAGLDGVEIVASHGYLAQQFLSEEINRRTDHYGGSFENRARFLKESVKAVRDAVGTDFVVGLRISGNEHNPEGMSEDLSLRAISEVAADLDYVSVVEGSSSTIGAAIHIVPPMFYENGYVAPFSERVKKAVSIPVLVTGRINQPQDADVLIRDGKADLCGMTRALICDPSMPEKATRGALDDIRACIACNQACIGHLHHGFPISCIQHPETGRERQYGEIKAAAKSKKVMVVGGGPGGMKAAATAALRGHKVTLYESGAYLGGQARLAQMLPGRAEFGGIITNLTRELQMANVEVRTRTLVDAELVASERPDVVILATGGKPRWPLHFLYEQSGGAGTSQVVQAVDVLQEKVTCGASVLIADWSCDWVGLGLAELLAKKGSRVCLAVNGVIAGEMIQSYTRDAMIRRISKLGVEITPYARLVGYDDDTVYMQHIVSDEPMIFENINTLVLAQGAEPDDGLAVALESAGAELYLIGDCQMPRTCEEAVFEGLEVGWRI